MDLFGFDEVVLETVGVGQVEHAARHQVDTLVPVLLPDSGEFVQAMKAGIIELADIFVVNKSDLPGAQRMATEVKRSAAFSKAAPGAWTSRVLLASNSDADSIAALSVEIDRHQAWLAGTPAMQGTRTARARYRLRRLIERCSLQAIMGEDEAFFEQPLAVQLDRTLDRVAALRAGKR
jgi:LAO/AO transport system kinase